MGGDSRWRKVRTALMVSIHAPAWGATHSGQQRSSHSGRFNPRPRMGGDHWTTHTVTTQFNVSIHAPAWGATDVGTADKLLEFQSTPPHGGRRDGGKSCRQGTFQSTPPHGGRPNNDKNKTKISQSFNPRPRMGGDPTCTTPKPQ